MFHVTVINKKELIKYLSKMMAVVIIIFMFTRYFSYGKNDSFSLNLNLEPAISKVGIYAMSSVIPDITENTSPKEENVKELSLVQSLFGIELGMTNTIVKKEEYQIEIEDLTEEDVEELEVELAEEIEQNQATEVVEENNVAIKFTNEYGSVKIRNETDFALTEEMLTPDVAMTNKENIIILQTHTCESYTPSENYQYEESGNFRTTDLSYNVARVGAELKGFLSKYQINAIHDITYHDFPAYSGSYNRSLDTVNNILANNPAQIVLDIHRDALSGENIYGPRVKIGEEYAAQIALVIGSNGGGLEHPNWQNNLKFAIKLQEKANELYPGLFRPIILRNSRYNQHVTDCAILLEVGATGNTMEEAINSMNCLAKVLSEI